MRFRVQAPAEAWSGRAVAVPVRGTVPNVRRAPSPEAIANILAGAAAGLFILIPGERWFEVPSSSVVWFTFGFLFAIATVSFRFARGRGENAWVSPRFLILALYAVLFGWGAVVVYYWGTVPWQVYPDHRHLFFAHGGYDNLPLACRLVLIAGTGLFIGGGSWSRRVAGRLPRLQWPVDEGKLLTAIAVSYPLLQVGYAISYPLLPPAAEFVVTAFVAITESMLVIASRHCFLTRSAAERLKWLFFLAFAYVVTLPNALRSGQMVPLFMPGLMILAGYVLAKRRMPWLFLATAIPVLVFILLPFTALYKLSPEAERVGDRLALAGEKFEQADYQSRLELALSRTAARFAVTHFPSVYVQFYPDVYPYLLGETFRIELSGLVPRLFWPDKPDVNPTLNKYAEGVGLVRADSGVSMVMDAVSEYYVNFGVLGVFLLSIVHGGYFAVLAEWLSTRVHQVIGTAIFVCLVFSNWDFFGVLNVFDPHTKVLPVWLAIYYVLSRAVRAGRVHA